MSRDLNTYIWQILQEAQHNGVEHNNIKFEASNNLSPYVETFTQFKTEGISEDSIISIEVNLLHRFSKFFNNLNKNCNDETVKDIITDLILHFLGTLDLKNGLNKNSIYEGMLYDDILEGAFGKEISKKIKVFYESEKSILLQYIVDLYMNGNGEKSFLKVVEGIFNNVLFYKRQDRKNEFILFIDVDRSQEAEEKLEVIEKIFFPFDKKLDIVWKHHFGIIGIEETMKIDEINII